MTRLLIALIAAVVLANYAQAFDTELQNSSYSVGVFTGRSLGQAKRHFVDPNVVGQGLKDALTGNTLKYSDKNVSDFTALHAATDNAVARNKLWAANKDMLSYTEGANIGKAMSMSHQPFDAELVRQGIVVGLTGAAPVLPERQMQSLLAARMKILHPNILQQKILHHVIPK